MKFPRRLTKCPLPSIPLQIQFQKSSDIYGPNSLNFSSTSFRLVVGSNCCSIMQVSVVPLQRYLLRDVTFKKSQHDQIKPVSSGLNLSSRRHCWSEYAFILNLLLTSCLVRFLSLTTTLCSYPTLSTTDSKTASFKERTGASIALTFPFLRLVLCSLKVKSVMRV